MDMLAGSQIAEAELTDWRKLAQGLHARFILPDFSSGVAFLTAVGAIGDDLGHHPRVQMCATSIDLELVSNDAVYRDDAGAEHVVQWVTAKDVELARRISEIARHLELTPAPHEVSQIELGLDAADVAGIAPVWAAFLTGDPDDLGRGVPDPEEIRDAFGRLPHLWFNPLEEPGTAQRFHVEVYLPPEVAGSRLAQVLAAGATVTDDSRAPGLTVIADPEGNTGVICVDTSAAPRP